ncbi:MAG: SUMF1/EgtB/PvdO family nonheme iron enzyme [Rhizonema sp. PD37]|nr:SUMF1/EgtB/PvdO family nonheme iron enzyme [Rhizonema sp. PD37]
MRKIALLIGVSKYEPELNPLPALPAAVKDVEAMRRVLANPEMGGFTETDIIVLKNPQPYRMQTEIDNLFADRNKDDLLLLYFSGHGIKDEKGRLYLSTNGTYKRNGRLVQPSAVAASTIHEYMNESRSQRQVLILDCCFSGAFPQGLTVKDDDTVNVQEQLGGKGRAILTSSTSTQYSFVQEGSELSIYTRYLVEGIEKGATDKDGDGWITVDDLHEYVSSKVLEAAPAKMTPKFYPGEEGFKIKLAKSKKAEYDLNLQPVAAEEQTKTPSSSVPQSKPSSAIQTQPFEFEFVTLKLVQKRSGPFGLFRQSTFPEINRSRGRAEFFAENLGYGVLLEMVAIPGGQFLMGSPDNELERLETESPQHIVTIQPFYMGKYAVTQKQWFAVMGNNPSHFQGAKRPVEQVSWNDAVKFCQRLMQKTGKDYRLPSEAEWEYAARAGTTTPFHFGETITTDLANYRGTDWTYKEKVYLGNYGHGSKGEYREQTTVVGKFPPNAFGLHEMHGNIWEWCQDTWHKSYKGAPSDDTAWLSENNNDYCRLLRGSSWHSPPEFCRSALRERKADGNEHHNVGFRVVVGGHSTLVCQSPRMGIH